MLFRWSLLGLLGLICLGLCGCLPGGEVPVDEQKNPYFQAGREREQERDYKGAIEAFEKALEINPRSAQAHFELGVLYDQHSDQKEADYVSAMFHYYQAIKLRPNEYPADNAHERIIFCKSELVKAESLAPVIQSLTRERDKLREENQLLHKQLDSSGTAHSAPAGLTTRFLSNRTERVANTNPAPLRATNGVAMRERVTPLPPVPTSTRTHTVKAGETPFSISRQYRVKLEALMSANPTLDAKRLKVGQVLTIPAT